MSVIGHGDGAGVKPTPITDIKVVNRLGQEIAVSYTIRSGILTFVVGRRGDPTGLITPDTKEVLRHG